jgi:hypothetical protein
MFKYWLKIGLGATVIFLVGYTFVSRIREVRSTVESDRSLTIPLGAFGVYLPFKLDGQKVGTLRSVEIRRASPREISGFEVRVRVADSVTLDRLRSCPLSINDAMHFDERTTFQCLSDSTGYETFGEVRLELRLEHVNTVILQPLFLPSSAVQEFRKRNSDSLTSPLADSLASALTGTVRDRSRLIRDSIRADSLENRARLMQRRADSLRGKALPPEP